MNPWLQAVQSMREFSHQRRNLRAVGELKSEGSDNFNSCVLWFEEKQWGEGNWKSLPGFWWQELELKLKLELKHTAAHIRFNHSHEGRESRCLLRKMSREIWLSYRKCLAEMKWWEADQGGSLRKLDLMGVYTIILKETEEQQHENMVIPKSLLVSREISLSSFPSIALICVVSHVKGSHLTYTLSSYL